MLQALRIKWLRWLLTRRIREREQRIDDLAFYLKQNATLSSLEQVTLLAQIDILRSQNRFDNARLARLWHS